MDSKKYMVNRKYILFFLSFIPVIIILLVIILRNVVKPSDQDIINRVKNIDCYTSDVEYIFKNERAEFKEETHQYYSRNMGSRIEFKDGYEPIKVYKGGEIKVQDENNEEFTLEKDIDELYPLAFIENILDNPVTEEVKDVRQEWGDGEYIEVDVDYNNKNKHLNKAKFYIDKNKHVPVLLQIIDDNDKERVRIVFKNFKIEKSLDSSLF